LHFKEFYNQRILKSENVLIYTSKVVKYWYDLKVETKGWRNMNRELNKKVKNLSFVSILRTR